MTGVASHHFNGLADPSQLRARKIWPWPLQLPQFHQSLEPPATLLANLRWTSGNLTKRHISLVCWWEQRYISYEVAPLRTRFCSECSQWIPTECWVRLAKLLETSRHPTRHMSRCLVYGVSAKSHGSQHDHFFSAKSPASPNFPSEASKSVPSSWLPIGYQDMGVSINGGCP